MSAPAAPMSILGSGRCSILLRMIGKMVVSSIATSCWSLWSVEISCASEQLLDELGEALRTAQGYFSKTSEMSIAAWRLIEFSEATRDEEANPREGHRSPLTGERRGTLREH